MDYIKIPLYLSGANATVDRTTSVTIGTAGSYGVHAFEIEKGRNWENLEVKATFYQKPDNSATTTSPSDEVIQVTVIETAEHLIPIPSEILQVETIEQGSTPPETWVTFSGYEGAELKMNSLRLTLEISDTGPTYKDAYTVTPDMEEQLINISKEYRDAACECATQAGEYAKQAADSASIALEAQGNAYKNELRAQSFAEDALFSAMAASSSEVNAGISEDNAKDYYEKTKQEHDKIVEEVLTIVDSSSEASKAAEAAKQSAEAAASSATSASESATAAKQSETNAKASEASVLANATKAEEAAKEAAQSESLAGTSASSAKASETNASNYAKTASSAATTATDAASEANTYKELAKQYANSVQGVKEASEAARDEAKQYAEAASTSAASAEKAKSNAVSASGTAQAAAVNASGYADTASAGAQNAAASARDAAKSAEDAAAELPKVQQAGTSAVNAVNAAKEGAVSEIEASIDGATDAAILAVQEAQATGISAVSSAQSTAISNIQQEATTQSGNIAGAASTAIGNVNQAGSNAIASLNSTKETNIEAINTAGTTNVGLVNTAGEEQIDAVEAAGTQQITAIGTAVTEGVADVNEAKDAAVAEIDAANAKAPQVNPITGFWQTWDSETGAYVDTTTKAQGKQGIQGEPGQRGQTGPTPNLTVGIVNTMEPDDPAQVFIEGTPENPVLNFNIPRGQDGEVGPGVPNGGTIGQVLTKKSTTDQDTEWANLPEYSVKKLDVAESGYLSSYKLTKDGVEVGQAINIPKDFLVVSADIHEVEEENVPYEGAVIGDPYLDFVVNTKDESSTPTHLYIPVKDLVDTYKAGNGIDITSYTVSIKLDSANTNGLSVTENGLKLDVATTTSSGAMTAQDKIDLGNSLKKDRYSSGSEFYNAYMIDGQTRLQSDGDVVIYGTADFRGTSNVYNTPTEGTNVANKSYVDDKFNNISSDLPYIKDTGDFVVGEYDFTNATLKVKIPIDDTHAANKSYVDSQNATTLTSAKAYTDEVVADMASSETIQQIQQDIDNIEDGTTKLPYVTKESIEIMEKTHDVARAYRYGFENELGGSKKHPGFGFIDYTPAIVVDNNDSTDFSPLYVGEPEKDTQAATKKYVDDSIEAIDVTAQLTPLTERVTTVEGEVDTLQTEVSNIKDGTTELPYLKDTGDSASGVYDFTGATLNIAEPTSNTNPATKSYVDTKIAGIGEGGEVVAYTNGNGITISAENVISVNINTSNSNGLNVDTNGLKLDLASSTTAGAMSSTDKIKLDAVPTTETVESSISEAINALGIDEVKQDITSLETSVDNIPTVSASETNGSIKIDDVDTTVYTHPVHTEAQEGLYKVAVDAQGHVTTATAITKEDITNLGIPAQDTTYTDATTENSGLMSPTDKIAINTAVEDIVDIKEDYVSNGVNNVAKGNPAVCEDSVEWPLQGMRVYGKSTQVTTTGAQLFDKTAASPNMWINDQGVVEGANGYTLSDYIPVTAGTYYGNHKGSARTAMYNSEKQFIRYINWAGDAPLTINDGESYLLVVIQTNDDGNYLDTFMLNAGSTALPYEPYTGGKPSPSPEYPQEIHSAGDEGEISITLSDSGEQSQSLTFSTPNGLPGIPVDSGGNFVDETGQEWICNYRDWSRGVDVKNISNMIYNSSDREYVGLYWNSHREEQLASGVVCFSVFYNKGDTISPTTILKCTHFPVNGNVTSGVPGNEACMAAENRVYFRILLSTIGASAEDNDNTLLQAIRDWLDAQLANETPVSVIVKIAFLIETPIPADELAAYRALHTYDGTTIISSTDSLAEIEIQYVNSNQTNLPYIKNKGDTVYGEFNFIGSNLKIADPTEDLNPVTKNYADSNYIKATKSQDESGSTPRYTVDADLTLTGDIDSESSIYAYSLHTKSWNTSGDNVRSIKQRPQLDTDGSNLETPEGDTIFETELSITDEDNNLKPLNVATPTKNTEAATKEYVDDMGFVTLRWTYQNPILTTKRNHLKGLVLYGVSTTKDSQIVSLGETGSVSFTFSNEDGTESKTLTISTPNGMRGILINGSNLPDGAVEFISDGAILGDEWNFTTGKITQKVGYIASYNGEPVGDIYITSTGSLTTGVQVVYKLDEFIVSDIPKNEMNAYKELMTYDGKTKITWNQGLANGGIPTMNYEITYQDNSTAFIRADIGIKDYPYFVPTVGAEEGELLVDYITTSYCQASNLYSYTNSTGELDLYNQKDISNGNKYVWLANSLSDSYELSVRHWKDGNKDNGIEFSPVNIGTPTKDTHATTKAYVDGKMTGEARVTYDVIPTDLQLQPNTLHYLANDYSTTLNITLASATREDMVTMYHVIFKSGASATNLTLPSAVIKPAQFTIAPNRIYELSIIENLLSYQSWEVS